jgi:hypothetical protein
LGGLGNLALAYRRMGLMKVSDESYDLSSRSFDEHDLQKLLIAIEDNE